MRACLKSVLLLPAAVLIVACGGYNKELAHAQGGYFDPEAVLPGKRVGYMLVRDRNGNVKSAARLEQNCVTQNRIEGECRTVVKDGNPALPIEESMKYRVHHEDNLDVTVVFDSPVRRLTGQVHGDQLIMSGSQAMKDGDTRLSVESRFHKIPGALIQLDYFSRWGIRVGSVMTTWVAAP